MKTIFGGTSLAGFWLEYPGSKNTQWLAPEVGQTWAFGGTTDNPFELPSPLQPVFNGAVISPWNEAITSFPTALLPVTVALPGAGYQMSMEGYPAPVRGTYLAFGFTNSGALTSNLTTSGALWLRMSADTSFAPLHYELRAGGLANGTLLASGDVGIIDAGVIGRARMAIRYSPAARSVTLTLLGTVIGTYPVSIPTPKYLAFEGIGVLDDLVLRQ